MQLRRPGATNPRSEETQKVAGTWIPDTPKPLPAYMPLVFFRPSAFCPGHCQVTCGLCLLTSKAAGTQLCQGGLQEP